MPPHKDTAEWLDYRVRISGPPGAGISRSEIGKALEGAGFRGYAPFLKGYAPFKKGPSLAGRTFQNIIVANYLFQPGFCPRLGFFIVSV